jgi:hypothetical protein
LDELQDLKDLYTYTFGARPRGPRANIASWLHGQIQNAQFEIMDENEAQTRVYTGTICITAVHLAKVRSPKMYEGLEMKMYEGLDTDLGIWIILE